MSERLRHLQRQQALLREHLAWIEAEIARETPAGEPPANTPIARTATAFAVSTSPASTDESVPSEADALIERYSAEERQNPADIRRGCLLAFTAILLLIIGGVTAVCLLYYR